MYVWYFKLIVILQKDCELLIMLSQWISLGTCKEPSFSMELNTSRPVCAIYMVWNFLLLKMALEKLLEIEKCMLKK